MKQLPAALLDADAAISRCRECGSWMTSACRTCSIGTPRRSDRFDMAPVLAVIGAREMCEQRDQASLWRLYHRARVRGYCSASTADKLAVGLLGVHPFQIWGDAWWDQAELMSA